MFWWRGKSRRRIQISEVIFANLMMLLKWFYDTYFFAEVLRSMNLVSFVWLTLAIIAYKFSMPMAGEEIKNANKINLFFWQHLHSSIYSFLRAFGSWGSGEAEFKGLEGVAIMSNGNILVCDRENHRVQIF